MKVQVHNSLHVLMRSKYIMIVGICDPMRQHGKFLLLTFIIENVLLKGYPFIYQMNSLLYLIRMVLEDVLQKLKNNTSKFLTWMETNKIYPKVHNLLYTQFSSQFVWKQHERVWCPRQKRYHGRKIVVYCLRQWRVVLLETFS